MRQARDSRARRASSGGSGAAWRSAAVLALACALPTAAASASGTPAGTTIESIAEVTFERDGVPERLYSPPATVRVAELVDATAVALAPLQAVAPGATGHVIAFRLVNLGNGPETYRLELDPAAGGAFPLRPRTPALYFDTDGSATLTAADVPHAPGAEPELPADGSLTVLAVVDLPPDAPDAARARVALIARATTGTGAPGTAVPGAGVDGVDALLGVGGGTAQVSADLLVAGARLAIAKSAAVEDASGGTRAESGARITYALDLTVTGTGVAPGVVLTDPLPPATRFVPGSLELDGLALTDAVDGDAAAFASDPPRVEWRLGDLPAGSARRARFAVVIE